MKGIRSAYTPFGDCNAPILLGVPGRRDALDVPSCG